MSGRGKQVYPYPKVRRRRCMHVHYSGRKCTVPAVTTLDPKSRLCGLHKEKCAECTSMAKAFYLPGQW